MADDSNSLDFNLALKSAQAAQEAKAFVAQLEQAARQAKVVVPVQYGPKLSASAKSSLDSIAKSDAADMQTRKFVKLNETIEETTKKVSGLRFVIGKFGTSAGTDPMFEWLNKMAPKVGIGLAAAKLASIGLNVANMYGAISSSKENNNLEGQIAAESHLDAYLRNIPIVGGFAGGIADNKYLGHIPAKARQLLGLGNGTTLYDDRQAIERLGMETEMNDARTARLKSVGDARAGLSREGLSLINSSGDTLKKRGMTSEGAAVVDLDRRIADFQKSIDSLPTTGGKQVPDDVIAGLKSLQALRDVAKADAITATQSRQALMRSSVNVADLSAQGMSYQAERAALIASRREERDAIKDPAERQAHAQTTRGLLDAMATGRSRQGTETAYSIDTGVRQDQQRLAAETLRVGRQTYQADVKAFESAQEEKVRAAWHAMQKASGEGAPQEVQDALQRQYESARAGRMGARANFEADVSMRAQDMNAAAASMELSNAFKPRAGQLLAIEKSVADAMVAAQGSPQLMEATKRMGAAQVGSFLHEMEAKGPGRFEAVSASTTDLTARLYGRKAEDILAIQKQANDFLEAIKTNTGKPISLDFKIFN